MKNIFLLALLLTYLLSTALGGSGWVVCYGPDGHMAVEPTHQIPCSGAHGDHLEDQLMQEYTPVGESCFDVPLPMDDHLAVGGNKNWQFSARTLTGKRVFECVGSQTVSSILRPPPRSNVTLACLRTVILLV